MTVTSTINRADYNGDGVSTQFSTVFRFLENNQLRVIRTVIATNVSTTLTLDSLGPDGYSVTGANLQGGGTVTVVTPPAGPGPLQERLSILRNVPVTQEIDYIANDPFPAESHERGLDKLTMIVGQQAEVVDRAIVLAPGTSGVSTQLPGPVALNLLRWKADLSGLENAVPPEIATISPGAVVDATVSPIAAIQSSKLSFQQNGGLARSIQDELRERVAISQFGAVNDGSTDSTPATLLAVAEALSRGFATVHIPAGIWRFASPVIAALTGISGIRFTGDGAEISILLFDTVSGNAFSISSPAGNWWLNISPHNRVEFRDLTICTTKTNLGTAIALNMGSVEGRPCAGATLQNVVIRGHNSFFHYFAKSVDFLDTTGVRVDNVHAIQGGPGNTNGIAFDIRASGPTTDPTDIKFTNCSVVFGQYGWRIGDHVEGVYLTQCDGINVVSKVYHHTTTGESGLHVIGGHANTSGPCYDLDGVFDHTIANVLMYSSAGSATWRGIKARNGGSGTYTGNIMRAGAVAGEIGIDIDSVPNEPLHGFVVSGNDFSNIDSAGVLGANARKVRWSNDNQYLNCPNRVQNLALAANANYVEGYRLEGRVSVNTVGGAQSETIDIPIGAAAGGRFVNKPNWGIISSPSQDAVGFYDRNDVNSTATNARCRLWKISGNLGAGPNELHIIFGE